MKKQPQGRRTRPISPALQQSLDQTYDFIEGYIDENRCPPTLREIAEACHVSHTTSSRYLDRLEQQGRIERDRRVARGIRLVKQK